MRVPQVSERIKEAPAQALRGVFAGIGQLLLFTDKLRNKAPGSQQVTQTHTPEAPETAAGARPDGAPAPVRAKAQPASDVKHVPESRRAPEAGPVSEAPKSPRTAQAPKARKVPATRDLDKSGNVRLLDSAEGAAAKAGRVKQEAALPLSNYDELSVASLRARLRYLDVAQLRQLAEYEKAHADRTEVMTMFERRTTKLEAEATARAEAQAEGEVEAQEEVGAEVEADVDAEAEGET